MVWMKKKLEYEVIWKFNLYFPLWLRTVILLYTFYIDLEFVIWKIIFD